jgi:DNA-binding transcriptional LysR family regulator
MQALVRVVETGSVSGAARSLRVGQPTISKALSALERDLGVQLLVRTTRKVMATEAGLRYYEHARSAIEAAEEAEGSARGTAVGVHGRLRLAAPVTFGRLIVVPALGQFLQAHPRLQLECMLDDRAVDIVNEGIDLALRTGPQPSSTLIARRLASAARYVVGAPSYLARRGRPKHPSDLLRHDIILYDQRGTVQRHGVTDWRFKSHTGETSVRVADRLIMTAAEGVRAAVLAGLGLAIGSSWMFGAELASGAVLPVLDEYQLAPLDLWAILPSRRVPARTRALLDHLQPYLDRCSAG